MLIAPYNAFILYSHDADEVLQPVAATLQHEIKDINHGRVDCATHETAVRCP